MNEHFLGDDLKVSHFPDLDLVVISQGQTHVRVTVKQAKAIAAALAKVTDKPKPKRHVR